MAKQMTIQEMRDQIKHLENEISRIQGQERDETIRNIKVAIDHYDLQPQDLFKGVPKSKKGEATPWRGFGSAAKAKKKPVQAQVKRGKGPLGVPKYQKDGQTWSGVGKRPAWMVAHEAAGGKRSDLLVKMQ